MKVENTNVWAMFQDMQNKVAEAHISFQQALATGQAAYLQSVQSTFACLSQWGIEAPVQKVTSSEYLQADRSGWQTEYTSAAAASMAQQHVAATNVVEETVVSPYTSLMESELVAVTGVQPVESIAVSPITDSDTAIVSGTGDVDVATLIFAIVEEATGYPAEMLEPGMKLESELGIDSIKRVQILAELHSKLPKIEIDALKASIADTLGEIIEHVESKKKE